MAFLGSGEAIGAASVWLGCAAASGFGEAGATVRWLQSLPVLLVWRAAVFLLLGLDLPHEGRPLFLEHALLLDQLVKLLLEVGSLTDDNFVCVQLLHHSFELGRNDFNVRF